MLFLKCNNPVEVLIQKYNTIHYKIKTNKNLLKKLNQGEGNDYLKFLNESLRFLVTNLEVDNLRKIGVTTNDIVLNAGTKTFCNLI